MAPPPLTTCIRGHSDLLRHQRPSGRRGNCLACARLHRTFAGIIPASPAEWPDLLKPGNERLFLRWLRLPRHHKLQLGGVDHAATPAILATLARLGL